MSEADCQPVHVEDIAVDAWIHQRPKRRVYCRRMRLAMGLSGPLMNQVTLRFYGTLNDFLPQERRQAPFTIRFVGRRSVKDAIESVGVPHPEIQLIVVNGEPASFDLAIQDGDRVAALPMFYAIDLSDTPHARPIVPETIRFALDGHLAKLARRLRLFGLDAACPARADDDALAALASREARVLLTRDLQLLKRRTITYGYFVRETDAQRQLVEVLRRYGPMPVAPFSRCLRCNGELHAVPKSTIETVLPPLTRRYYDDFQMCAACGRVYWRGSHWFRLQRAVDAAVHASLSRV